MIRARLVLLVALKLSKNLKTRSWIDSRTRLSHPVMAGKTTIGRGCGDILGMLTLYVGTTGFAYESGYTLSLVWVLYWLIETFAT